MTTDVEPTPQKRMQITKRWLRRQHRKYLRDGGAPTPFKAWAAKHGAAAVAAAVNFPDGPSPIVAALTGVKVGQGAARRHEKLLEARAERKLRCREQTRATTLAKHKGPSRKNKGRKS